MSSHHIVLPSKLIVAKETNTSGSYEIEGLSPGYGHTLGNSLRRIILSSLPGAAITLLKIEGAQHEFSTLEGIKEDVINLILNLKQIRFRVNADGPQTVQIKAKGARLVTAKDIEASAEVEVLNPDHYIGEITSKQGALTIEMTVERGLGFVPKEMHRKEKVDIGTIAVDAIFTPIRRMNYEVENMRVGDQTDYNKLRLNIETDGSVTPREALERATTVMITQLKAILDLKDIPEVSPVGAPGTSQISDSSSHDVSDVLKTRVDNLNLSTRTLNALANASIRTIGGIVRKTEEDLLGLEGIGAKGIDEIKELLEQYDMTLKE